MKTPDDHEMWPPVKLPAKTPIEAMFDIAVLYDVIDQWYEFGIRHERKPGSELWVTVNLGRLVQEIKMKWSAMIALPRCCFPWTDAAVALLVTKKRKEPDKPLKRLLQKRSEQQGNLDL